MGLKLACIEAAAPWREIMGLRFFKFEKKKSGHKMHGKKIFFKMQNFFKLSIRGTQKSLLSKV